MKALTIKEILESSGGEFFGEEKLLTTKVHSIVTDSRKATKDSMFVAIKGERSDGHKFVGGTYENGAVCALVEDIVD